MNYELTQHAQDVIEERRIPTEWLERALAKPALVEPSAAEPGIENRFAKIPEFGD